MTAYTSTTERHGSAAVEVATVHHEGRDFTALGSVIDTERGLLVGYPKAVDGFWCLTTWNGETIARLDLRRVWAQRFGGQSFKMYAWRCSYEGRVYTGRNGGFFGESALVRLRARGGASEG